MKTMHLFAGIGGGLLADRILGHEPIIAVEWDKYACQVLRERAAAGWLPDLRVWEGDVRMFDPSEYAGKVDCIHAGFPCQDISVAGKQAGVSEGTRSGLYREVLRIADTVRPKYLFLENVAAILSNGLGTVLGDLAQMGYDTRWCCLRASDVGAPHHRDRWWLYAYPNNSGLQRWKDGKSAGREGTNGHDWKMGAVLPDSSCCAARNKESQGLCQDREIRASWSLQPRNEDWNSRSINYWWSSEPELGRVANGIPNRVGQLKGYGNAQVPLQAAVAWKLLGGQ